MGIGDREKYNRLAYFNNTAINPVGAAAGMPNLTGLLSWVGQGNPSNQQSTDWRNFAPRFGIAYSLDKKTVFRGGYGIFFLPRNIQGDGAVGSGSHYHDDCFAGWHYSSDPRSAIPFHKEFCPR